MICSYLFIFVCNMQYILWYILFMIYLSRFDILLQIIITCMGLNLTSNVGGCSIKI